MNDQVDGIRRYFAFRVTFPKGAQLIVHAHKPGLEAVAAALVKSRKAAYNAFLATGKCQIRAGDQEHGGSHQRQLQIQV